MRARPAAPGPCWQFRLPGQPGERLADVVIQQPGPGGRHEKRVAARAGEPLVAQPAVVPDRGDSGGMEREQPVLAGLAADQQQALPGVEVGVVERGGFAAAHAGDGHQPDERLERRPPQRRLQRVRLRGQRGDVRG